MAKQDMQKIIDAVWDNGRDTKRRYIPRSYSGGTGWGVFDQKIDGFVDHKLDQIDPSEPMNVN